MAGSTTFLENAQLNGSLRGTTYTAPTTVYFSLHSTATTDAGGGTELTGNGYARAAITFGAPSGSPAVCANAQLILADATGNWAAATHGAVWDASSGGNMLYHGPLTASVTVLSGNAFRLVAGALTITRD